MDKDMNDGSDYLLGSLRPSGPPSGALLRENSDKLLQAEKMASLCRLSAGIAHEINNPIAFVSSNLRALADYIDDLLALVAAYEGLEERLEKESAQLSRIHALKNRVDLAYLHQDVPKLLEESLDGVRRVRSIVQGLRDFTHDDGLEWQVADLRDCLECTLAILRGQIDEGIEIVRDYGDMPEIYCQPSQLNLVFMDLLINAAEAIGNAGVITVRAGRAGDEVRVEISDNGKGIKAEYLSCIFDPFFSTKPVGKGLGLGLSRAYGVVSTHQGKIDVQSEVGKGSCFCIVLPVWHPDLGTDVLFGPADLCGVKAE